MKVIDLHCDTISLMIEKGGENELLRNNLSVDLEKLTKGNYLAQFFAMFIGLSDDKNPYEDCLDMIDRFYYEIEKNKNKIDVARNYDEMIRNYEGNKLSAFLTVEEGGVLKGKLSNLRNLYRLGVRLITLTWNYQNEIGYPNAVPEFMGKGLTDFGREVVCEMNRLGMLIDVSHLSDGGFYDVAKHSKSPFIASHSNSRSVMDCSRNLDDNMIKVIAEKGGVTGINFAHYFLGDNEKSTIDDMILHIKHIKNVGGIDVIALGTDFDGITSELEIKDASEMDKLSDGLEKEGFSIDDIEKIFYKNAIRVIKDVLK